MLDDVGSTLDSLFKKGLIRFDDEIGCGSGGCAEDVGQCREELEQCHENRLLARGMQ